MIILTIIGLFYLQRIGCRLPDGEQKAGCGGFGKVSDYLPFSHFFYVCINSVAMIIGKL